MREYVILKYHLLNIYVYILLILPPQRLLSNNHNMHVGS